MYWALQQNSHPDRLAQDLLYQQGLIYKKYLNIFYFSLDYL